MPLGINGTGESENLLWKISKGYLFREKYKTGRRWCVFGCSGGLSE
ncbi:hypothetical protein [uncultured Rikenella sp.]|nr:hypothetical protein [uncultured Rikenella sp.]